MRDTGSFRYNDVWRTVLQRYNSTVLQLRVRCNYSWAAWALVAGLLRVLSPRRLVTRAFSALAGILLGNRFAAARSFLYS